MVKGGAHTRRRCTVSVDSFSQSEKSSWPIFLLPYTQFNFTKSLLVGSPPLQAQPSDPRSQSLERARLASLRWDSDKYPALLYLSVLNGVLWLIWGWFGWGKEPPPQKGDIGSRKHTIHFIPPSIYHATCWTWSLPRSCGAKEGAEPATFI